jgi:phosphatidylinositol alpha-1,6-mannosyltransferase
MSHIGQQSVLLITRNFPPLVGGMERLNHHIYLELQKEFKVALAGPLGCMPYLEPTSQVESFPASPKSAFVIGSFKAAWRLAHTIHPNIILCGSGATALAGFLISRRLRVPFAVYLHGLDVVSNHFLYRAAFLPAIRACDIALVNSSNTGRLASLHGVPKHRIKLLHPGVTLQENHQEGSEVFRQKISAGDRPILLSVGRLTPRKGLVEFITHCLPMIARCCPNVLLVIIGSEANEALGSTKNVTSELLAAIMSTGLGNHVQLLGRVDDASLFQAYQASQLLIFPALDMPSDVEGFGMVAIEAAAHGLPTIAFAAGGVSDAVSNGLSGYLIPPKDYQGLTRAILDHLNGTTSIEADDCRAFAATFKWQSFGERLRAIMRTALS